MSISYFFHEPGSVPGIPGLFSGVRVDVADDGSFEVSPLPYHPHVELAPVEEAPAIEEETLTASEPTPIRKKKATTIESEV